MDIDDYSAWSTYELNGSNHVDCYQIFHQKSNNAEKAMLSKMRKMFEKKGDKVLATAEVSIITDGGEYVVQSASMKSETFSENPFEYEFMYVPLGDDGVYAYTEPWNGFSVNKNSDNKEYAVEFIRFLMTEEQLNTMAEVKGMPSAAVNPVDERYPQIHDIKNLQGTFENNGSVSYDIRQAFAQTATDFGAGKYKNAKEAAAAFVKACAEK